MRTTQAPASWLILLALMTGLAASALAVPPGYERPAEEQAKIEAILRGDSSSLASPAEAQAPILNQDGDKILCAIEQFDIGTFGGSDVWGWEAPDGREYAIMGVADGVAFVNVTDGYLVGIIPGPADNCSNIRWRDIKNYGNYCYVTSECTGSRQGLMIIDMSPLPSLPTYVRSYTSGGQITSHNLSIDTAKGYAYVLRSNYDGFRPLDLSNPEFPQERPSVFVPDIHDVFARNDTVWVAEANSGTWSAWNMANKNSPQLIVRVNVPNPGYVHNIWPSEDGTLLATTEETPFKTVKLWDVSDYGNVQLVGEYLGPNGLAHNAHFEGDYLYLSHYESGVIVLDVSDPSNPFPVSQYDTWLTSDNPEFNGCWGIYPHTNSGKVYSSNLYGRLYVLDTTTVDAGDTLTVDSVVVFEGDDHVNVNVSINNQNDVRSILVPFTWAGPYDLRFDSATTTGLRTDYFEFNQVTVYDAFNARGVVSLASSLVGTQPDLPPGSGPVVTLHFRINGTLSATPNPVALTTVNGNVPVIGTQCYAYSPETKSGFVTLWQAPPPCCVGTVGDANGTGGNEPTISDISTIIDFLFITGTPVPCLAEADANTSGGTEPTPGDITVSDISVIIDYLFITGTPLAPCP